MNQLKQADINELLEMVELRESRRQMVGSLSGESKGLVLVVNHFESSKLFLDEPTTGMDLEAVDNFGNFWSNRVYICCGDP